MPSAMVAHGIDTTVVEIDPVVHEFAAKYFQLRENNPPVLEDAIGYTARLVNESKKTFDYIVHDVFTGGAEPVELFTIEFLQNLRSLLKPDGVIAIVSNASIALFLSFCVSRDVPHVLTPAAPELCRRLHPTRPPDYRANHPGGLPHVPHVPGKPRRPRCHQGEEDGLYQHGHLLQKDGVTTTHLPPCSGGGLLDEPR